MQYLKYNLEQDRFINRFLTTDTFCKPQKFKKAVLHGRVNEWLKYGFSIHENPCRKEFLAQRLHKTPAYLDLEASMPGDPVEVFEQKHPLFVYFPFGNVNVECSRFYYVPTFLRTYFTAFLYCSKAHTASLELCTCGGMTLWINDDLICDFTPFTRNMRKTTTVSVSLREGLNKIVVCLDDLAERDTDYYFRIAYTGADQPQIWLPVADTVDTARIHAGEALINSLYFERDVYMDEDVTLCMDNNSSSPLEMQFDYALSLISGRIHKQETLARSFSRTLSPGCNRITVFRAGEVPPSFYYLQVGITLDRIKISRKIGTQVFSRAMMEKFSPDIEQRRRTLQEYVYQACIPNVYHCAVEYLLGKENAATEQTLLEELDGIEMRKDCSDFHLVMVLYLYRRFACRMSARLKERIQDVVVHFRYWIDEPGDDVMWFFSENHALLFHICQYEAGILFPQSLFTTSGRTGVQQTARARELLQEWFDDFSREFITEWNSNAYIPVDVLGLGTLYAFTETDDPLHCHARRALDTIFINLGINAFNGALMTSFGRSYEEMLKGNYIASTSCLLYFAFNRGCVNCGTNAYISLLMSDYVPPEDCARNLEMKPGQALIFRNTQGYENHVNLYLFKNHEALLSTAVAFKPYQPGYQEHIMQATADPVAQLFVNHPGEGQPYGSGRPNYWAGNGVLPCGVQYLNTGILIYDIDPEHLIGYTHAYFPTMHFDEVHCSETCLAGRKGNAYLGAIALNGLQPVTQGPMRGREFRSTGRQNVWVLQVASTEKYASLAEFVHNLQAISITQKDCRCATVRLPDATVLDVQPDGTLFVNGKTVYDYPLTPEGKTEIYKGVF